MKIVVKTYLLIGILISLAAFNLFLLYQQEQSASSQSYSIIRAGDVKVKAESISSLATSIANGNLEDRDELQRETDEIESILIVIKNGGEIKGQMLEKIPASVSSEYNKVSSTWESYKSEAMQVEKTSVFDQEATSAMNYVLQKNQELVLYTDALAKGLQNLDRNYNTHKQIAEDLAEGAKIIGQQSLLISIGEGEDVQDILKQERLKFEIGIRKLLQISTAGLDVESVGAEAVVLYQEHNPQVLLLDLAMPKKDGLTVVKEVIEYDPNAKIILITASDDQKIIAQCLEHGAKSAIAKPFDFNSVLKSITSLLEN